MFPIISILRIYDTKTRGHFLIYKTSPVYSDCSDVGCKCRRVTFYDKEWLIL